MLKGNKKLDCERVCDRDSDETLKYILTKFCTQHVHALKISVEIEGKIVLTVSKLKTKSHQSSIYFNTRGFNISGTIINHVIHIVVLPLFNLC